MADTDTVAVQYEVDREAVERIIRIQQYGLVGVWELVDQIFEIAESMKQADGLMSVNAIEKFSGVDDLDDDFGEWVRQHSDIRNVGKIDVFVCLELLEKSGQSYELGPILAEDGEN